MQIFIIGSVLETARTLDKKRFNRQISEAQLILDSINGNKHWKGPLVDMYKDHIMWLRSYISCFKHYKEGDIEMARNMDSVCKILTPPFFTDEYFNNMKKRLYTKDRVHYSNWSGLGESFINMYWDNMRWEWIYIEQKKAY